MARLPASRATAEGGRDIRRALLVVGSPRGEESSSNRLGQYLMDRLAAASIETQTVFTRRVRSSPERMRELLDEVQAADLVVLASPVYVDSLPAPVIAAFEAAAAESASTTGDWPLLAAIVNSGFPEATHGATALAVCERFAEQAGFEWAGGLSMGGGELIAGQPLDGVKAPLRRVKAALASSAEALAEGKGMPKTAVDAMAKPVIPPFLYHLRGERRFRARAKKYGPSGR